MSKYIHDDSCLFCKIVDGKIPCFKTYEDDAYLGFLDVFPRNEGHSLLIPKKHHRFVYDVEDFGGYFEKAKILSNAIAEIIKPKYMSFQTFGTEVPHAHIHIVPYQTMTEDFPRRQKLDSENAKGLAEKILGATRKGY